MARVLLILIVLAPVSAAPGLKPTEPPAYHPTTVGAKWVYQQGRIEITFVVTRVEIQDGATIVDVASSVDGGVEVPCQVMRVAPDGVFRVSVGGTTYPKPECLLKLPHKDGQEWEVDLEPGGGTSKLTAVRREAVETPAGKFDAIRVEREGDQTATYWFAEGVGLVKATYKGGERVLRAFESGKK